MEVVINKCFGGFGLSVLAFEELIKKGWKVTTYNKNGNYTDKTADIVKNKGQGHSSFFGIYNFVKWGDAPEIRANKDVIEVVKRLKEKSWGRYAKLEIVEIPDDVDWQIEEYDGSEHIAEKHRTW